MIPGSARVAGNVSSWKKFQSFFLPFVLFHSARGGVFTEPVSYLFAIMGFYVITYEEILGISSPGVFGTENKPRRRAKSSLRGVSIRIRDDG